MPSESIKLKATVNLNRNANAPRKILGSYLLLLLLLFSYFLLKLYLRRKWSLLYLRFLRMHHLVRNYLRLSCSPSFLNILKINRNIGIYVHLSFHSWTQQVRKLFEWTVCPCGRRSNTVYVCPPVLAKRRQAKWCNHVINMHPTRLDGSEKRNNLLLNEMTKER